VGQTGGGSQRNYLHNCVAQKQRQPRQPRQRARPGPSPVQPAPRQPQALGRQPHQREPRPRVLPSCYRDSSQVALNAAAHAVGEAGEGDVDTAMRSF
jgi:hypothetical protein